MSDSTPSLLQVVKVESDVSGVSGSVLTASQNTELHFLRSRVRELEREKAELSAENQRLKNMLVHGEITWCTCLQVTDQLSEFTDLIRFVTL